MRIRRVLILILCVATVMGAMTVQAQAVVGPKQVTIAFGNLMLIVDGKQITVLNDQNQKVEIFSLDGIVYVPARTLSDLLGKAGQYNSTNSTYAIAKPATNPVKWVPLYDRPYIAVSNASGFRAYVNSGVQYLGANISTFTELTGGRYQGDWDVTYKLNGAAQKVSGTICKTASERAREAVYEFYDDNNKLLYRSPIMTSNIGEKKFEFNTGNTKNLKLKIILTSNNYYGGADCYIKDMQIYTTDYTK